MKHIVALSGGKDSTAMAVQLSRIEPRDYVYICNETGNELPEMRTHWDYLSGLLGAPITPVRYRLDLIGTIREQKMLPNVFARWCTRILKIEPTLAYFEALPQGSVLYVGLRADEEMRRGLYGDDITVRFPMREWKWTEFDVYAYLQKNNISIPPRTDCGLCPYQRLGEWRTLYFEHRDIYNEGIAIEAEMGATIRSPGRDTWPASLAELAQEFDRNRPLREYKRATTCRVCSL